MSVMEDAFETALCAVADAYEAEYARSGGKSLSRVATIVASSGAFFNRVREGKTFSVHNLNRFVAWFRQPTNWPTGIIPQAAASALASIGRPPLPAASMPHTYRPPAACVRSNDAPGLDRGGGA